MNTSDFIWELVRSERNEMERREQNKIKEESEANYYRELKGSDLQIVIEDVLSFNIIDQMWYLGYTPKIYCGNYAGLCLSNGVNILKTKIEKAIGFEDRNFCSVESYDRQRSYDAFIEAKIIMYMKDKGHIIGYSNSEPVFSFVRKDLLRFVNTVAVDYGNSESLYFNYDYFFRISIGEIISSSDSSCIKEKITKIIDEEFDDVIIELESAFSFFKLTTFFQKFNHQVLFVISDDEIIDDEHFDCIDLEEKIRKNKNIFKGKKYYNSNMDESMSKRKKRTMKESRARKISKRNIIEGKKYYKSITKIIPNDEKNDNETPNCTYLEENKSIFKFKFNNSISKREKIAKKKSRDRKIQI